MRHAVLVGIVQSITLEDGAAMAEYGLLLGLIALIVAAATIGIGEDISAFFTAVDGYIHGLAL